MLFACAKRETSLLFICFCTSATQLLKIIIYNNVDDVTKFKKKINVLYTCMKHEFYLETTYTA